MQGRSLVAPIVFSAIAALGSGCPADKATTAQNSTSTATGSPSNPSAPKVERASDAPGDGGTARAGSTQEAVAVIAVPGMRDIAGDKPYVAKLLSGKGVGKIEVDFDAKRATIHYDPSLTKIDDVVGRLKAKDQFAESTVVNNRIISR
jgi:hypothetical protein